MNVTLSAMQVMVVHGDSGSNGCKVCVDGQNCNSNGITAQTVPGSNSIKIYPHVPGRHNYTISNCLTNSLFSQ